MFWLGTLLSIIIPSAASLAVILMATLYPVLKAAKMTPLTAAGVIATTATIVPTPLGGDNVVAARVLGFDHVVDYVFYHHAVISIPAIIVMGIVHYFWQKHLDRTEGAIKAAVDESELRQVNADAPAWYAVFPCCRSDSRSSSGPSSSTRRSGSLRSRSFPLRSPSLRKPSAAAT